MLEDLTNVTNDGKWNTPSQNSNGVDNKRTWRVWETEQNGVLQLMTPPDPYEHFTFHKHKRDHRCKGLLKIPDSQSGFDCAPQAWESVSLYCSWPKKAWANYSLANNIPLDKKKKKIIEILEGNSLSETETR